MSPAQIANLERTLSAFLALVTKIEQIAEDPEFARVFDFYFAQGGRYDGPTWEKELAEAQACLREARALGLSPDAASCEVPGSAVSEGAGGTGTSDRPEVVGGAR